VDMAFPFFDGRRAIASGASGLCLRPRSGEQMIAHAAPPLEVEAQDVLILPAPVRANARGPAQLFRTAARRGSFSIWLVFWYRQFDSPDQWRTRRARNELALWQGEAASCRKRWSC